MERDFSEAMSMMNYRDFSEAMSMMNYTAW